MKMIKTMKYYLGHATTILGKRLELLNSHI